MATYGYGRVSRDEQTSENQRQVLELQKKMRVDEWFEDHAVSGKVKAMDRKEFARMTEMAVTGDTVVFTRVDRIGRKASNILTVVEELLERGVEVYILQIGDVALSSPIGKMLLGVFAIFAEGERDSIVERTKDGLARTKAQGTVLGRPLSISPEVLKAACQKREEGVSLAKIGLEYNVDKNTILQACKKWGDSLDEYKARWEAQTIQAERKAMAA